MSRILDEPDSLVASEFQQGRHLPGNNSSDMHHNHARGIGSQMFHDIFRPHCEGFRIHVCEDGMSPRMNNRRGGGEKGISGDTYILHLAAEGPKNDFEGTASSV